MCLWLFMAEMWFAKMIHRQYHATRGRGPKRRRRKC